MAKTKIAILFGGVSEEHPISVKSAQEVARNLNLAKYQPYYVGITTNGRWRLVDGPETGWDHGDGRRVTLSPDRGMRGLLIEEDGASTSIAIDVVLPVLHGRFGEDGAVQGLLELAGIPYVGCDIQSSALAMDKSLTYLVARSAGIATPTFWTVTGEGHVDPVRPTYPVFVKPARSGSSFGVTRVDAREDLARAVGTASRYDSKVLIEEAVVGSEIGCAVLETDTELIVGEADQIRLSHGFFRIHQEDEPEAGSDNSTVIVPAEISPEARRRVKQTARDVYRALGCRGLARVDMFLKADGEVVLNEVNTFPGITSYSRYPRMMAAAGIPFAEVIDRLVAFALSGQRR